ncbi:hypothetical protein PIB30_031529 [Stylosanthes scabra]|uniref:VQ domain-containing protein n=1 Tax=Stylosanthes scabra TaxID=79078 RepID=A0ABU6ZBZ5_9FABA|nr:hypothetical protein [Stylosanthes scabra]
MVKNLNKKSSHKVSKNHERQQQQLKSLINVLKPKVYITDTSSFKQLVQELTGINNGSSSSSSTPPFEQTMFENCPDLIIGSDEVQRNHPDSDTSFEAEASVETEATTNSPPSDELCYSTTFPMVNDEELDHVCNQMVFMDDVFFEDTTIASTQNLDPFSAYQNLESLLFDIEPNQLYNSYAQIDQGVSIYDYELSGIL